MLGNVSVSAPDHALRHVVHDDVSNLDPGVCSQLIVLLLHSNSDRASDALSAEPPVQCQ